MNRRTFLATTGGAMSAALAGCIGRSTFSPGEYDIGMSSNAFTPETYTISVGDTVVWKNTSSRAHSVTAYENAIPADGVYFASGGFESEQMARKSWVRQTGRNGGKILGGKTYKHTFDVPGTYNYFCIPHEMVMVGKIIVEEKNSNKE
jgi:plastocyanin